MHNMNALHRPLSSSPVHPPARRSCAKQTCISCSSPRRHLASSNKIQAHMFTRIKDQTASFLLSVSLAAAVLLQQPAGALADTTTTMPPPSTSSSSAASQAATRTVVDVVSGENTVLNEGNTPDNREGSTQEQKDSKKQNSIGDTSEVGGVAALPSNGQSVPWT